MSNYTKKFTTGFSVTVDIQCCCTFRRGIVHYANTNEGGSEIELCDLLFGDCRKATLIAISTRARNAGGARVGL